MRPIRAQALLTALTLLGGLGGAAIPAVANTLTMRAELRPTTAKVGDRLQLTVTVQIKGQSSGRRSFFRTGPPPYQHYKEPSLAAFEVLSRRSGQSSRFFGLGRGGTEESVYTYQYTLRAKRPGAAIITPATLRYKGKAYRSNPLRVTVAAGPAPPPPALPGQKPTPKSTEDVFVQVVPSKLKAWVGEQITVTWYLYLKHQLASAPSIVKEPKAADFFAEDLTFNRQHATQTTLNGELYTVLPIYKKAFFPLRAGALQLGSLAAEVMTVQGAYYQLSPALRSSAPLTIQVKQLPRVGVPKGFVRNNIGRYYVNARVKPTKLKANSAASLVVTISGQGLVHGLKVKRIKKMDGFKVRFGGQKTHANPNRAELSGSRVTEYVLIPTRGGTLVVPPICFPHFNPKTGRYVANACSRAITVSVEGSPKPAVAAGAGVVAGSENELHRRLKPILRKATLDRAKPWDLHKVGWLLWILVLLPPLGLIGLAVGRRLRVAMEGDSHSRRRRQSRQRARERLKLAQNYMKDGDRVGFFGEIANVIQERLSAQLGVRVQGLTTVELQELLSAHDLSPALQERVSRDLEVCDFARFAPAAAAAGEMQEVLRRTRETLAEIGKAKPLPKTPVTPEEASA